MHADVTCAGSGRLVTLEKFCRTGIWKIVKVWENTSKLALQKTSKFQGARCCFETLNLIWVITCEIWRQSHQEWRLGINTQQHQQNPKGSILCLVSCAIRFILCERKLSAISIPHVPEYGQLVCLFIGIVLLYVVCSSGLSGSVMHPYGPAGICLYYSWARLMNWTQTQS